MVTPDQGERLTSLAALLAEAVEKVQRLQRINVMVSHKVLGHFDHIFRLVAQAGRDIGLYNSGGKKSPVGQNYLLDARA